jgi:hypothetical protein
VSEHGEYTLSLECDRADCEKADDYTAMYAVITQPTRMHALAVARERGWMIQHGGRVLCPDHANEKRITRREVRP